MLNEINVSNLLRKKGIHMTKQVSFIEITKEVVARQWFLMLSFIRKKDEVS